jgi:hypothetical protein
MCFLAHLIVITPKGGLMEQPHFCKGEEKKKVGLKLNFFGICGRAIYVVNTKNLNLISLDNMKSRLWNLFIQI